MEKFGHYFEFFAAVNSAYIVSNFFLESIISKMNSHYADLKARLSSLDNTQTNNEKVLVDTIAHDATAKRLSDTASRLRAQIIQFGEQIEDSKNKASISHNFNYICLYGAFYCISILIANGYGYEFHSSMSRGCFFIFNVASIVLLSYLFFKKPKFFPRRAKPSHFSVFYIFLGTVILSCPTYYLIHWLWPNYTFKEQFSDINTILSLSVPTAHFFYYFIRASITSKSESKRLINCLSQIEKECWDFKLRMEEAFTTLKDIEVTK